MKKVFHEYWEVTQKSGASGPAFSLVSSDTEEVKMEQREVILGGRTCLGAMPEDQLRAEFRV